VVGERCVEEKTSSNQSGALTALPLNLNKVESSFHMDKNLLETEQLLEEELNRSAGLTNL